MLLDSINDPTDLGKLSYEQLDALAGEIRQQIIDAVSAAGSGHLGSNLGVVELTLAVHRVFESPRDILLWDTGHQAYVHKILTGRRDDFATLRRAGGLSGYPSRTESEHDWVENSHASTILCYAHGLAEAHKLRGLTDRNVVAVIGDGSMTGGMAFEGLNNLGHSDSRAVIILNDNGRSYAPTVSRLSESLGRIRLNPAYVRNRARLDRLLHDVPLLGDKLERGVEGALAAVREMFEPPAFFEMLGVRYTGPFDGHDIAGLERALRNAREFEGPIVVHVLTQKGRGYAPAENDPIKRLHDVGGVKPGSYTAAFTEALIKEAEHRPEVVALTAAMPDSTGLLPYKERFPDRFFDVGIAEQHAVTAARAWRWAACARWSPSTRRSSTGRSTRSTWMWRMHGQPVVFCLDRAGITGDDGASHHGVLDMVLLSKVPGMTIFAPSSYREVGVMLHDALELCTDRAGGHPVPEDDATRRRCGDRRRGRRGRLRPVRPQGPHRARRVHPRGRQDARAGSGRRRGVGVVRPSRGGRVGRAADQAARRGDARRSRHVPPCGHRRGRLPGRRRGFRHRRPAGRDRRRQRGRGRPPVTVLGVPVRFIAHGKPDDILASIGLDATGITATVRAVLTGEA